MSQDLSNLSPEQLAELQRQNCIFCKIIAGEIPSKKIYEDEKVLVILDINPGSEGHCLLLPKKHYQIMPQIPKDDLGHLFVTAKKISRTLLKALGLQGTSLFIANGAAAGQKAPHFMMHVIPRHRGDMLFSIPKNKVNREELVSVHEKLIQRFGGKKPAVKKPIATSEPKIVEVEKVEEIKDEDIKPETNEQNMEDEVDSVVEELSGHKDKKNKHSKANQPDIDKISKLFT
ncbi:HIT family protein [Candidatus Woesearchaeota archaeon]|nr:HIT family protein [Candidatus Woesearchaeota archaeon]